MFVNRLSIFDFHFSLWRSTLKIDFWFCVLTFGGRCRPPKFQKKRRERYLPLKKLKLPWAKWNCREQVEIAVRKLKLPWHFRATVRSTITAWYKTRWNLLKNCALCPKNSLFLLHLFWEVSLLKFISHRIIFLKVTASIAHIKIILKSAFSMQIIKLSINDSYMKFTRCKIEHNCAYPH